MPLTDPFAAVQFIGKRKISARLPDIPPAGGTPCQKIGSFSSRSRNWRDRSPFAAFAPVRIGAHRDGRTEREKAGRRSGKLDRPRNTPNDIARPVRAIQKQRPLGEPRL